jgi:hypothetical protein
MATCRRSSTRPRASSEDRSSLFLVKECPSCGRGLRFPIDRGRIRVRCVCGHQFIADPRR